MHVLARPAMSIVATIVVLLASPLPAFAGAAAPATPDDVTIERIQGQVTGGFQLTPVRFAATTPPGGAAQFELLVVNQTGRAAEFSLSTVDVVAGGGEEYSRIVEAGSSPIGAGSWIRLPASTLRLGNLQQAKVAFRVTAPSDASPGGHYGGIAVSLVDPRAEDEELDVVTRIVSNVIAMVPGNVTYDAGVSELELEGGPVAWGEVTARTTVVNTGNIHTTPDITVRFDGEPGGSHDVPGDVPELLPGGERTVTATWDDPPLLGRVRVTSEVELENGETIVRRSGPVWVITPTGAGLVLAILAALVVLVVLLRRRRETRRWIELELSRMDDEDPDDPDVDAT